MKCEKCGGERKYRCLHESDCPECVRSVELERMRLSSEGVMAFVVFLVALAFAVAIELR